MPSLNEINRIAREFAEREAEKRIERQKAEFKLAMVNATILFIAACSAIIAVGTIYHGGLGWLL